MPLDGVPRKADPREVGWQFDDPEFEVHFWIGPTPDGKWLESFLVAFDTDEPFEDVRRWADEYLASHRHSESDRIVIWVRFHDSSGVVGRIRMAGRPWDEDKERSNTQWFMYPG